MDRPTFAQRNPKSGLLEIIDMYTGNIVAIQTETFDLLNGHREIMAEHTLPSGEKILLQKGIDPGLLIHSTQEPFSQHLVDLICQEVIAGRSLTKICTSPGFPKYSTLTRWYRQYPHVKEQIEEARLDRAEQLRDLVKEEADEAHSSKDPAIASNIKIEAYKWLAGMDNSRYSPKSKVEATLNVPTQIVVHTGIVREVLDANKSANENILQGSEPRLDNAGLPALGESLPGEILLDPSAADQPIKDVAQPQRGEPTE